MIHKIWLLTTLLTVTIKKLKWVKINTNTKDFETQAETLKLTRIYSH